MRQIDQISRLTLLVIAFLLGVIALNLQLVPSCSRICGFGPVRLRPNCRNAVCLQRQSRCARNGQAEPNVWFIPKVQDKKFSLADPVFVVRVPLEKLDEQAR